MEKLAQEEGGKNEEEKDQAMYYMPIKPEMIPD